MIDTRTGKDLKEYPILDEQKLYLYLMLNEAGKVKIGVTKNIQQRYQSLCGSNSTGDQIIKVLVSPSTYLYTLEPIMHNKFAKYRIPNTEWFYNKEEPSGKVLFENACEELKILFSSTDYKKCNELRKNMYLKDEKVGGVCDN